ncbi:FAD-binding protein [Streptomyces erythrochromogenes]|uniref:FAD-binding protein n=1 Tax=Streptomyces erythrochromogenes TaxID=285574 RepID=UPI0038134BF6
MSRRRTLQFAAGAAVAGAAAAGITPAAAAPAESAFASAAADVIIVVVGGGLADLVDTNELAAAGRGRVVLLDQEPEASPGGQSYWSLDGLLMVDSPEQRLCGIKDTLELARPDWYGTAAWNRGVDDRLGEDHWGRKWADT